MAGDPTDGIRHAAVFIRAEVVDVDAVLRLVEHGEDGVDTVLHVEVALALGAVAEDAEAGGIVAQGLVEVQDVAVGVAFAEDGHEAEDEAFHGEAFAVGGDQPFGGDFAGAVEGRLDGERGVFGGGDDGGFAVDGAGGGEGDALDVVAAHGFEDVPGDDDVLLEVAIGVIGAEADIGVGGEVDDEVGAGDGFGEGG